MRARTNEAKDERRTAFLMAAMDEFFENGFAAARVDDIARRAGLSKGTLYLYFKSKKELFQGLIDMAAAPKRQQLEKIVSEAPTATAAIEGFLRFAPVIVRQSIVPRIIKVMIGDSRRFPEVAQTYNQQVIERTLGLIADILKRGHDNGEFTVENPELTASLVIAPIFMSLVWHILFEQGSSNSSDFVDLEALFSLHHKMLMKALGAGNTA